MEVGRKTDLKLMISKMLQNKLPISDMSLFRNRSFLDQQKGKDPKD